MPQHLIHDGADAPSSPTVRRRWTVVAAATTLTLTVGLAACGDDDTATDNSVPATETIPDTTMEVTPTTSNSSTTSSPSASSTTARPTGSIATSGDSTGSTAGNVTAVSSAARPPTTDGAGGSGGAGAATTTNGDTNQLNGPASSDGTTPDESGPPSTIGECDEYVTNVQYPLEQCNTGYVITLVQQALRRSGQDVTANGNFDQATHDAVRAYQEQAGLTVDGLVGSETWKSLIPDPLGVDLNGNGVVDPFEVTTG